MDAPIANVRITRGLTGETVCEVQVPIGITVWKLKLEIEKTVRTPAGLQQLCCNMQTLSDEIWSEMGQVGDQQYTARKPLLSSLRRNLQREHLERLIDLMMQANGSNAAYKPIATLAMVQLETLKGKIDGTLEKGGDKLDAYSRAHLLEASRRIESALDADFIYNAS